MTDMANNDRLQETEAALRAAQIDYTKTTASWIALKASVIKKIQAQYGADVAITSELLWQNGYDAAAYNIMLARKTNALRKAGRDYANAGGTPTPLSSAESTAYWKEAGDAYGVTIEEMANANNTDVVSGPPPSNTGNQTKPEENKPPQAPPQDPLPEEKPQEKPQENAPQEEKPQEKPQGEKPQENKSEDKKEAPVKLPENNKQSPAKVKAPPKNTTPSSPSLPSKGEQKIDWQKPSNMTISSQYVKTYTSYSGHDMVAIFEIPLEKGSITHVVGELQTISYSMYNEKMPVRVLGDMNMKSVVFGNRTIAGSMVFTVFDRHWAHKMMDEYLRHVGSNAHILTDELPPINITISMCNEYGDKSRLAIYGVTFVMEGQTMSVQDMYTENTFQYMAKDLDYLTVNVDSNGGAKSGSHAAEKPKHDNDDTKEEAPVDLPAQETPSKQEVTADKPDYSQAFVISEDDLKKGRNHCLAIIDSTLRNLSNTLLSAKENGAITQGQYVEWYASLKKAWQKGRQDIDKYFENQ